MKFDSSFGRSASALVVVLLLAGSVRAADVLPPLPSSSTNAALHYQRALLYLAEVDPEQRQLLRKPIWEIINSETAEGEIAEIDALLIASQHAIRAALVGARQAQADFGTDLREYSASTMLPHVGPMSSLAKLVTLYGIHKQAEGDSQRAAELFLLVIRMGSHMQQQLTLAESLEGEGILETGYHALCNWAVRCDDTELIDSVRSSLNSLSANRSSPASGLAYEASVVDLALDNLLLAYPDGNWAEIVLRAVDATPQSASSQAMREAAKAAVLKRGVPESVFEDEDTFLAHVEKLRTAHADYYRESLACLSLPPESAIAAGQKIYDEYSPKLKALGDPEILNPGQIAAYYAVQNAELQLANLVLLLSSHREGGQFPEDLSSIVDHFGGELPANPFGSGEVVYSPASDGNGFEISYPGAEIAGIKLPEVAFEFSMAASP